MASRKKGTRSKKRNPSVLTLGGAVGRAIGEAAATFVNDTSGTPTKRTRTRSKGRKAATMPPQQTQVPVQQHYPCPRCGQPLAYIVQYKQWYCYTCQAYASQMAAQGQQEPATPPPPPPGTYVVNDQQ